MDNSCFARKWDEAQKLFKEFKVVTFGSKKNLMAMIKHVRPKETLKYVDSSNITIVDKQTGKRTDFPGTLFISNERIFLYQPIPLSKETHHYEYTFEKLRSVSSRGNELTSGKIRIDTDEQEINFIVSYHASVIEKITAIINSVIETVVEIRQEASGATIVSVECGGCGAVHVVEENTMVICTWCDRPLVFSGESNTLAKQSSTPPTAISTADELMKFKALLDSGVITEEEFAHKKKELLGL